MTGEFPNAQPDKRYTIKETAKMLDIHRNTLRRYTQELYIVPFIKTIGAKSRTYYYGSEINRFWKKEVTPSRRSVA